MESYTVKAFITVDFSLTKTVTEPLPNRANLEQLENETKRIVVGLLTNYFEEIDFRDVKVSMTLCEEK